MGRLDSTRDHGAGVIGKHDSVAPELLIYHLCEQQTVTVKDKPDKILGCGRGGLVNVYLGVAMCCQKPMRPMLDHEENKLV